MYDVMNFVPRYYKQTLHYIILALQTDIKFTMLCTLFKSNALYYPYLPSIILFVLFQQENNIQILLTMTFLTI